MFNRKGPAGLYTERYAKAYEDVYDKAIIHFDDKKRRVILVPAPAYLLHAQYLSMTCTLLISSLAFDSSSVAALLTSNTVNDR